MALMIFAVFAVALPIMAFRGEGYRGAYLAAAVIGFFLCLIFNSPTVPPPNYHGNVAELEAISYGVFAFGLGLCVGGILAACVYRPRVKPAKDAR